MAKPVDLTGQRKGFLNIVEKAYKKNNNYYYKCVCDLSEQSANRRYCHE